MKENLNLKLNYKIKIAEEEFLVIGGITFYNVADCYKWEEYKIKNLKNRSIKWLSIDVTYDEYAIYTEVHRKLNTSKYKKADYGRAKVVSYFGDVDVDKNEIVDFEEYEDSTEEKIIGIERWADETEYSQGYYIDKEEITIISKEETALSERKNFNNGNGQINKKSITLGKLIKRIIIISVMVFVGLLAIGAICNLDTSKIRAFLEKDQNFVYETSITSDLNSKEKADVYSTSLTIEEAAKKIIDSVNGKVEDVQENTEDNTVAILTKKEYCLVYSDETNNGTLIQISSRRYTYSSTNRPYRSSSTCSTYYRSYYYSRGYFDDESKYKRYNNGFENETYDYVDSNLDDKYKDYSYSVRQSSASTRTSSGGGISSGK